MAVADDKLLWECHTIRVFRNMQGAVLIYERRLDPFGDNYWVLVEELGRSDLPVQVIKLMAIELEGA